MRNLVAVIDGLYTRSLIGGLCAAALVMFFYGMAYLLLMPLSFKEPGSGRYPAEIFPVVVQLTIAFAAVFTILFMYVFKLFFSLPSPTEVASEE
jgi:hypothetical protein